MKKISPQIAQMYGKPIHTKATFDRPAPKPAVQKARVFPASKETKCP